TPLLRQIRNIDPKDESIMQLTLGTLGALRDIYALMKRIVQAYAASLALGRDKGLEPSQMDRFLITIFKCLFIRKVLPLYKSLMVHMEAMFAARDTVFEAYDWDTFPLYPIVHPSRSKNAASKTAPEGVCDAGPGGGKKRVLEDGNEPEAKKPKHEGPEETST